MNLYNKKLKALGLVEISTGGGCTALEKKTINGGRILITNGDAQAPAGLKTHSVVVGFYDREDNPTGFVEIAGGLANIESLDG